MQAFLEVAGISLSATVLGSLIGILWFRSTSREALDRHTILFIYEDILLHRSLRSNFFFSLRNTCNNGNGPY
jgi:hypothetical protein